ncbi:hypothetical protein VSDG_05252 [Cytospora chrysosperma]|uniref:Uncharacterized protein n=1 Tax=Cytospora chrysosperma TaxID=252740 RepID=A0A423VWY0_CYTCH|nr:hypothetical protein VSDG_05252 [Valsa sordida]
MTEFQIVYHALPSWKNRIESFLLVDQINRGFSDVEVDEDGMWRRNNNFQRVNPREGYQDFDDSQISLWLECEKGEAESEAEKILRL